MASVLSPRVESDPTLSVLHLDVTDTEISHPEIFISQSSTWLTPPPGGTEGMRSSVSEIIREKGYHRK
jgi:hypothetical protein